MKRLTALSIALGLTFGISAQRASGPSSGWVEWVIQPLPSNRPQTAEEQKQGSQFGRALPEPELLQPSIDSSLPSFQPRRDIAVTGSFKGACSDVLPDLVKRWTEAFRKYYPEVRFDVPPPFAGSVGAQELVESKLDFVFVSRELRPDDLKGFKAKFGYDPLSVPVSAGSYRHYGFLDAVGFLVNKDNPIERISFKQLDGILSRTYHRGGTPITTWGQMGLTGEWADKPIHIYGIKPWNGYEEFIRQRVLSTPGQRGEWREDINFEKVVFPIAGRVAADRYGIGYTGIAYVDAGVKMLPLARDDDGPYFAPTYENVARATYPLSRLIYFNVNREPRKPFPPALEEFLRFILSREGQQIVLDQGIFLPLRTGQAEASRSTLR